MLLAQHLTPHFALKLCRFLAHSAVLELKELATPIAIVQRHWILPITYLSDNAFQMHCVILCLIIISYKHFNQGTVERCS